MQQIRFNKTLPLKVCLLQPVWFNTKTYKICCFTHVGGYSFLPSLYLPWQCRKGNNPIQTHRLQEHIQQEKLTGKRFRKHAAYTRMGIDTEKKTELVKRQGLQSHEELKNISQKTEYEVGVEWKQDPANQNTVATQPWIIPRALQSCTLDEQALLKGTAEMDM